MEEEEEEEITDMDCDRLIEEIVKNQMVKDQLNEQHNDNQLNVLERMLSKLQNN